MTEPRHLSDQIVRLDALALRQHAVFGLDQLIACGLSARAIQRRAQAHRLFRIYKSVYFISPASLLSRDGRYMAAVLACGPGAVISHRSAAALHELRATDRAAIEVTVPGHSSRSHQGIEVHRSTTLTPRDVTAINNIPVTTVARTIFDLAAVLPRRPVERAIDQAAILEVLDARALDDQIERNRTRPAAHVLREILDTHRAGTTATQSELEERFLALLAAAGFPLPEVNAWITPPDGGPALRADFLWREQGVIVETDGHDTHRTREAFENDRRRDQRLTLAGWRVIRLTWDQVVNHPDETIRLIAGLLAQAAA